VWGMDEFNNENKDAKDSAILFSKKLNVYLKPRGGLIRFI
jgi:hypothetical protein